MITKFNFAALVLLPVALLTACNDLSGPENQSLQKLRSGQYTLIRTDELETLKQVGRYKLEVHGYLTWRIDTATGNACLVLAPQQFWEKQGREQQCKGQDAETLRLTERLREALDRKEATGTTTP